MLLLTLIGVFIASFGLVVGTYVFMSRRTLARQATARRRLREPEVVESPVRLLRDDSASAIPLLNEWLDKLEHTQKLRGDIRAAGLETRPAVIIFSALVLGGSGVLLAAALRQPWLGLVLFPAGFAAPYLYLRVQRRKRLLTFESQLPEAIDLVVNAMRAGYSFQSAMELVGQEMPDPIGKEFARFYDEQRAGIDVRGALLRMQERMPSTDLKMFVTAVLIQRETGGNLGEVLSNISHTVRERFRIQGELRTLTSQVRLSARILAVLPILMVFLISLINPEFIQPLFRDAVGRLLLVIAAAFQVTGYTIMRKLAAIEI
jgi:tight adherence protein B